MNGVDKFYGLNYIDNSYNLDDIDFLEKVEKIFPNCIRCNGNNIVSAGPHVTDNGKKHYRCKDCRKEFMELKDYTGHLNRILLELKGLGVRLPEDS